MQVAEYVGVGVSNDQCGQRWLKYLDPRLAQCKHGEWTDDEVTELTCSILRTDFLILEVMFSLVFANRLLTWRM